MGEDGHGLWQSTRSRSAIRVEDHLLWLVTLPGIIVGSDVSRQLDTGMLQLCVSHTVNQLQCKNQRHNNVKNSKF